MKTDVSLVREEQMREEGVRVFLLSVVVARALGHLAPWSRKRASQTDHPGKFYPSRETKFCVPEQRISGVIEVGSIGHERGG